MSFGAGTTLEVNSGGSDTANGGGFDTGATFATDLAATSATSSAPVVTSASYNFITRDNAQFLYVGGGTNWTRGMYPVTSTAGNAATLNAAVGAVVLYNAAGQPTGMNTVAGCATTASPTSGTWGLDYSRGTAAVISYTDMVIDATTNTKFTSSGNPVGPHVVGNLIAMTSGTGFTTPQWVEALSVSGTTAVCDKALGSTSSTGGHGGLGGCLATVGKFGALHDSGNTGFVLGGTTATMSGSSNVAGGRLVLAVGTTALSSTLCGYLTHRFPANTDGSRPILQPLTSTNNVTCVVLNGQGTIRNIDFENANACTGCVAVDTGGNGGIVFENCKMSGLKTGIRIATNAGYFTAWNCEILLSNESSALGVDTPGSGTIRGCYIHGGTGSDSVGISGATYVSIADTVIANITGSTSTGVGLASGSKLDNVTVYNITGIGIDCSSAQATWLSDVYTEACTVDGIKFGAAIDSRRVVNCGGYNNGANYDVANATALNVVGYITCTASALNAPGSGDFGVNDTAGGGLLLRAGGFPGSFPGTTTTSYPDVGAAQHQAAAAGASAWAY